MSTEIILHNDLCAGVEEILNYAWHNAVKYNFDPTIGNIHKEYLDRLKKTIGETKKTKC